MTIKELIKDNRVYFDYYRQGIFYYTLMCTSSLIIEDGKELGEYYSSFNILKDGKTQEIVKYDLYQFPVPIEDIGTATLPSSDKAITFMRWIRKAMEDKTLIKK